MYWQVTTLLASFSRSSTPVLFSGSDGTLSGLFLRQFSGPASRLLKGLYLETIYQVMTGYPQQESEAQVSKGARRVTHNVKIGQVAYTKSDGYFD